MSTGLTVALLALLGGLNAWLVAAEYAVVTVPVERITRRRSAGSRRAKVLTRILDDLEPHIAAIRMCSIALTLGIGWIGVPLVGAALVGPLFAFGIENSTAVTLSSAVASFFITATAMMVLGESLPKRLGLRRAERVALWSAHFLRGLTKLSLPIRGTLAAVTSLFGRAFGFKEDQGNNEEDDQRELRLVISQLTGLGRLSATKREFLENVLAFSSHTARGIMVPRDRMQVLSLGNSPAENLEIIRSTGHTRYPLCENGLEAIVGMIHIKDLFRHGDSEPIGLGNLLKARRKLPQVPETLPLDQLQQVLDRERAHMALVVDEHGATIGLVTLENVLEKLVGDIHDEFDGEETPAIAMADDGLLIDGMMLVDDLCRELEVELEDGEADTVGGFVTESLGKIGKVGDRFRLADFDGRVAEMQGRRISRIHLSSVITSSPRTTSENRPAAD
jgi:CBS domain containing-hemolysin-like protein